MIITAYRARKLDLSELYSLYSEENDRLSDATCVGIGRKEKNFIEEIYDFLSESGNGYCILENDGKYLCAMRFEPYRDGALISCLETRFCERRRGYASQLMSDFLKKTNGRIYSHVAKNNRASLNLHRKCGFEIRSDTAVLLDGTVSSGYVTMVYNSNSEAKRGK